MPENIAETVKRSLPFRRTASTKVAADRASDRIEVWLGRALLALALAVPAMSLYYTLKVSEWQVMTDELLYAKLALSIAKDLSPVPIIHGHYYAVLNQLYPIITAPFFGPLSMPAAFRAVHVLNVAIMTSTAIPAYLLTRDVVGSRFASLAVATLTVSVPWMTLSTLMVTEVVGYPIFIWAALAIQRCIVQPSTKRDLLAIGAVVLAVLARTQFLLLAVVLPASIILTEVGYGAASQRGEPLRRRVAGGLRTAAANHRVLTVASGAALVVVVLLRHGGRLGAILGNYRAAGNNGALLPPHLLNVSAIHLDFVLVGIGVVPLCLAAGWAISRLWSPTDKSRYAFAVLLVILVPALTIEVASFDVRFAAGVVHDRYLFYLVPLVFVGMAACVTEPRFPRIAVIGASIGIAYTITLADYEPSDGPFFGSPVSAFHVVLTGRAQQLGEFLSIERLRPDIVLAFLAVTSTLAIVIALARLSRVAVLASLVVVLGGFMGAETWYAFQKIVVHPREAVSGITFAKRDWIDRALPDDASAGLVPSPIAVINDRSTKTALTVPSHVNSLVARDVPVSFVHDFERLWWDTELWNKQVDFSFSLRGSDTYTPFPTDDVRIDPLTGHIEYSTHRPDYLVIARSEPRFRPRGRLVARTTNDLDLIKLAQPDRSTWISRRIDIDGWTAGRATIRIFEPHRPDTATRVGLMLASSADLKRPGRYLVEGPGLSLSGSLQPGRSRRLSFVVCNSARGFTDIKLTTPDIELLPAGRRGGLRVVEIETIGERSDKRCKL